MYSAINLAKYIVQKCIDDNCPISNLQLQKILYYIQKDYLNRGIRAFPDEIEAWQFGPAVPNVYYYFCGFGAMPISSVTEPYAIDNEDARHVDPIIKEKRKLNPWDMVQDVHKRNGAWDQTYRNGQGNHKTIDVELIRVAG